MSHRVLKLDRSFEMDINLAQDKEKWWDILNIAMSLQVPCNVENSLTYCRAVKSLKMDSATLSYNENSKKKKIMMKKDHVC
jgi:hypothetical protein